MERSGVQSQWQVTALAIDGSCGAVYVAASEGQQNKLLKTSWASPESQRVVALQHGPCKDIASQQLLSSSGLVAAACGSEVAILQGVDDHVVTRVPSTSGPLGCQSAAWRTEHQLWTSDLDRVRLWDLRNLARSVYEIHPAAGAVHTLVAVREGVLAATATGAYAMAFAPDGAIRPVPAVLLPVAGAAGTPRCVGLCAAQVSAAESVVVSSFLHPSPAGAFHSLTHSVGVIRGAESPLGPGWRQVGAMCGVAQHVPARGCALRLPGAASSTLFVSADDVSGAAQLWDVCEAGGAVGAAPLASVGGGGAQRMRLLHLDAAAISPQRWGVAAVRAPCHGAARPTGAHLTLTSVAVA